MKRSSDFCTVLCWFFVCWTLWCCVREVNRTWAAVECTRLGIIKPKGPGK